jgi:hypothetical protein
VFYLRIAHADLAHALSGSVNQRCQLCALHSAHRQELFLRCNPVGHINLGQGLPLGYVIKRGAHKQPFDVATGPSLHKSLVALVKGNAAHGKYLGREQALGDSSGTHAQVLLDAWADGDIALVGTAIGVDRHQHHVHEG